jgi:predicted small lipoprotein YifL
MKRAGRAGGAMLALLALLLLALAGCKAKGQPDSKAEAPPPAQIENEPDVNVIKVDHPEQPRLPDC